MKMVKSYLKDYQNILVTGGAGFIGKNLIINLLNNFNSKIFNLDKLSYASDLTGINNSFSKSELKNYKFINVDLINKKETLKSIKSSKPDLVFHLAAESHVDRSIDSPDAFIQSNIMGTFNLLKILTDYWQELPLPKKNIFKLIYISTDEVFGSLGNHGKFDESSNYNPQSPYSASKAACDHLVRSWHNTYGLPVIITHCSNNFGPWQYPEKLIPLTIMNALNGSKIPLYGDGENIRDWLFVQDHVEALTLISKDGEIGQSYCIGANNQLTNKKLLHIICQILQDIKPSKYNYVDLIEHVKDRPGHDFRYAINSSKIQKKLNWKSKYNFHESLKKTIEWYIKNIEWCNKCKI